MLYSYLKKRILENHQSKSIMPLPKIKNIREIKLTTFDHVLIRAWLIAPDIFQPDMRCVIFLHGNRINKSQFVEKFEIFKLINKYKIIALIPDYRDFGDSMGEFCVKDVNYDVDACFEFIRVVFNVEYVDVVAHSLGAGIALEYAKYIGVAKLFDNKQVNDLNLSIDLNINKDIDNLNNVNDPNKYIYQDINDMNNYFEKHINIGMNTYVIKDVNKDMIKDTSVDMQDITEQNDQKNVIADKKSSTNIKLNLHNLVNFNFNEKDFIENPNNKFSFTETKNKEIIDNKIIEKNKIALEINDNLFSNKNTIIHIDIPLLNNQIKILEDLFSQQTPFSYKTINRKNNILNKIVIISTFTSILDMLHKSKSWTLIKTFLPRYERQISENFNYDNLINIEFVDSIKIIVLHGNNDFLIPIHHGKKLAEKIGKELIVIENADHNNILLIDETWEIIFDFFIK
ncbi:hypothetical protein COBT_002413 [Conglomerata obtusa]